MALVAEFGLDTTKADAAAETFARELDRMIDQITKPVELSVSVQGAVAAVGKLGNAFDEQRKQLAGMISAQESALAAMRSTGQHGTDEYDKLLESVKADRAEMKRLEQAAKDVQAELADPIEIEIETAKAQSAMDGLVSQAKSILSAEALGKAGDFLTGFAEDGAAARDAMLQLQAQTGATGEKLEELKGLADKAFKVGVGENIAEARKAIATAQQQMGQFLDAEGIEKVTTGAAGIAKVFDKDVSEVIGKSRTLITNFGIEGEQGMQLMALAAQKGGTAMDDVLDTMDEYSQLAKQTGASAEQWTGLLINGVQLGARDTDKIADSLKELQIRLKAGDTSKALSEIQTPITKTIQGIVQAGEQGKKSSFEVAQQTAQAIEKAFNAGQISETMRSQLQVAVAGTPAEDLGSDLYGRIFSAPIDENAINEQASKAAGEMEKALGPSSVFEKIGRQFDLVKTKVSEFAAPVVSGLGGVLSSVSQVGPGLSLLTDKLGGMGGIVSKLTGAGGGGGGLGGMASGLMGALGPAAPWIAGAAAAVALFVLLYNKSDTFRKAVDNLVKKVTAFATELWENIKPALEALWEALKVVGEALFTVGEVYVSALIDWFGFIIGTIADFVGWITNAVASLLGFSGPGELVQAILKGIGDGAQWVANAMHTLTDVIKGAGVFISTFATEASSAVDALFSFDFAGAADKIFNAFNVATDAAAKKVQGEQQKRFGNGGADLAHSFIQGYSDATIKAAPKLTPKITPTITPKVTTPSTKAIVEALDFTAEAEKISKEVASIRADIGISESAGEIERYKAEFEEKQRVLTLGISEEIKALEEKAKKKKKLSDAEQDGLNKVLAALEEKRAALQDQLAIEQQAALLQIVTTRVTAEQQASTDIYNKELDLLRRRLELATGETLDSVKERNSLTLEQLELQQRAELETMLAGLEAQGLARLEAAKEQGILTDEEVRQEAQALRLRILNNNETVRLTLEQQKRAREAAQKEALKSEDEALQKSNLFYRASVELRRLLEQGFTIAKSAEELKRLEDERSKLTTEGSDLWKDYLSGKLSHYEDFITKLNEIDAKRAENEAAIQAQTQDLWTATLGAINTSAGSSFKVFTDQQQDALTKSTNTFISGTGELITVAEDTAKVLGGVVAEAAVSGENMAKFSAKRSLEILLTVLESQAAAIIALIIGKSFVEDPILGLVISTLGIASFTAAAEAGKAALRAAEFANGGDVLGPKQLAWLNDGPGQLSEFVVKGTATRRAKQRYPGLLEALNQEEDISRFFVDGEGRVSIGADVARAVDRQTKELKGEMLIQRKQLHILTTEFQKGVKIEGDTTMEHGQIKQSFENAFRQGRS